MKRVSIGIILLAISAAAQGSQDAADKKELFDYVLTMDKLQRLGATFHELQALIQKHPELNTANDGQTLDATVRNFEKYPDAVAVVKKNGFTPREFILGTLCAMQCSIAVGLKKAGTFKEYPPDLLKQVSKSNLEFTEQHYDEIKKLMASAAPQH
jgi:hypothetical protein